MVFSQCQQMTEVFPPPSLFLHTQENGSAIWRTRFLFAGTAECTQPSCSLPSMPLSRSLCVPK